MAVWQGGMGGSKREEEGNECGSHCALLQRQASRDKRACNCTRHKFERPPSCWGPHRAQVVRTPHGRLAAIHLVQRQLQKQNKAGCGGKVRVEGQTMAINLYAVAVDGEAGPEQAAQGKKTTATEWAKHTLALRHVI